MWGETAGGKEMIPGPREDHQLKPEDRLSTSRAPAGLCRHRLSDLGPAACPARVCFLTGAMAEGGLAGSAVTCGDVSSPPMGRPSPPCHHHPRHHQDTSKQMAGGWN